MLTNEVPDASAGTADDRAPRRRKRRVIVIGSIAAVFLAFCGLTARLFIVPVSGMPARVDAIVMMAGPGDRYSAALSLAEQHRAPVLVISRGSDLVGSGPCAPPIQGVREICFDPNPDTTQGEAEYAARLARQSHWHSVALVTITPQDSRARLRMERCFSGHVYVMTAPIRAAFWPYELAYEWAATAKALTINRSC
ncbi:MAG: YdcF family protein [Streptosporangiaceae bacterium]